jgi:hypothetical protein
VELDVTDEKTRQQVMTMLKATGLIRNLEARITTRSGEERDMLYSMEMLEIDGEPHSLATLIDITKRKQAEKAMRESEERFRLLFENNHTVMMLIEPVSGAIRNANVAASEFYGYSLSELCAMNINDINIGDGATISVGSDCYPATVIKKTACTVTVQRDQHHCAAPGAPFTYTSDPNGTTDVVRLTKRGWRIGRCMPVHFGHRRFYYDPSF